MTFDEFRLRMLNDLGRFMETEEATHAMEYDEWLMKFSLFATRRWVVSGYGEREDLQ